MGAVPLQFGRRACGGGEMQGRAVVAGDAETHALGREGDTFDRARVGEFLHLAVGEAHPGVAAAGIGDGTLRARCHRGHPFLAGAGQFFRGSGGGKRHHLAVLAARDQQVVPGRRGRRQKPIVQLQRLLAVVEPVHHAVGEGEKGNVVEEGSSDAMAFEIKRGDCGHEKAGSVFDVSLPLTLTLSPQAGRGGRRRCGHLPSPRHLRGEGGGSRMRGGST